jgi:glycine oxidase
MNDFLIIGNGLAGIFITNLLLQNNKTVYVIADNSQNSTEIAGGLYNPVVLKRFTLAWEAHIQSQNLLKDYQEIADLLKDEFIFPLDLHRKLSSIEEQNNWTVASDKNNLENYLETKLINNSKTVLNAEFGFGKVNHSGFVDTKKLKSSYNNYLIQQNLFLNESFNYQELNVFDNIFKYRNLKFKNIIFCEGFGLKQNHFFNYLPLDGTKGELLTIKSEKLNLKNIINSSIFVLPIGENLYKVGATYNWKDKDNIPTEDAKNELITQFKELVNCDFEVIEHQAGVRPTVNDRKPLLGEHPKIKNMFVLNGLGTRGVMLAPYLSKILFSFIENKIPLPQEIDIKRYQKFQKYV